MGRFHILLRLIAYLISGSAAGSLLSILALFLLCGGNGCWVIHSMLGPILAGGIGGAAAAGFMYWWPLSRRERILFIVAGVMFLPGIGLVGDALVYQPLKFGYVIHHVESAETPAQERAALALARRCGWWEIHLESPPKSWVNSGDLDLVVRDPERILAVEVEFFETKPNGVPYRAYRTLLQKSNIYVLTRE